ncbi:TKL protein kinase [Phytophthora cinnamomi]|uniref:TKL protein kinase n=1 Tax=Phytophthora cinnamomi TaxID=4785 RepID=UPI00355AC2F0|nr:TKL protein kinase [Phytophthora cinnamomi]
MRRELEDSWAPTRTFSFDGSTSDLALQLYTRSKAGDTLDKLSLSSIPDTVTSRLGDVNVAFDDLDGFAQRAVLWDSGFALTPANDVKQIWTLDGRSMAEIALTLDEFDATTCTTFDCTQPDGTMAHNNHLCTGTQMLTAANRRRIDTVPEIGLAKHTWTDGGVSYKVYAVHTLNTDSERSYGACPSTETYGYLNFPCYGSDDIPSSKRTVPTPTDWVTSWMKSYATGSTSTGSSATVWGGASGSTHTATKSPSTSSSTNSLTTDSSASIAPPDGKAGPNVALLGGAVGGGLGLLLVAVLVALFVFTRRKKSNDNDSGDRSSPMVFNHVAMTSPNGRQYDHRPKPPTQRPSDNEDPFQRSRATMRSSEDAWSNPSTESGVRPPPLYCGNQRAAVPEGLPPCYERGHQNRNQAPPPAQGDYRQPTPEQATSNEAVEHSFGSEAVDIGVAAVASSQFKERRRSARPSNPMTAPTHVEKILGMGPHNALQVLAADPSVDRRRVQLNQLQVERQLPMTTLQTDSFIGSYDGQHALIKRLAPSSSVNVAAVESLAFEIQNRAHTGHRNLVQFIGAGWTSAQDLAMVVEFHPQGTLRSFLDRNQDGMTAWTSQKTKIAGGIARGLAYLHKQTPAFIHHELCVKNVLLTDELEAKLASCGSTETKPSLGAKQKSHQAYWVAPEVLKGEPYSPAADVYSFEVLLAELDTCRAPYFDALALNGGNMEQTETLELVKEGRLRPSFSAECPSFIRHLGEACCQQDPARRLTAQQIVQLLEGR